MMDWIGLLWFCVFKQEILCQKSGHSLETQVSLQQYSVYFFSVHREHPLRMKLLSAFQTLTAFVIVYQGLVLPFDLCAALQWPLEVFRVFAA